MTLSNDSGVKTKILSISFFICFFSIPSHADQQSPTNNLSGKLPGFIAPDALSKEKPELPDTKPGPLPKPPKFSLPPIDPDPEKASRLSSAFRVFIEEIRIVGNTAFKQGELKQIIRNYENRSVTNEELQTLRHQLTRYYIDQGYINSGVILPDQEIKEGLIQLQVIEGELSQVEIKGNDWLRSSYIDGRVAQGIEAPLNIKDIQQRLLLLQQDPLVERINAELHPGLKPGESRIKVHVTEARPYEIGVVAANDRSPSIGSLSGQIWLRHRNLTGFGDALFFSYSGTEGLDDLSASYSIPLTSYDTRLNLYYQTNEADVIEKGIDIANIHSHSETFGVSVSHPLYRTPKQALTLSLAFEHRRSKTFFDNSPFSFALGVPENGDDKGESKISVLRFTQEWLDRSLTQVVAARSTFNLGFDALGATNNSSTPDGQFFVWLGQFQWVKRLPFLDSQTLFRTDVQLASDSLLPLEKFSVGGMRSVRGYRENQLVRDNGAVTSLEWRIPVFRLPIPALSSSIIDGNVQLATFADFGWSENQSFPTKGKKTIASWGLGLLWNPSPKVHTEFYWGLPFSAFKEGTEHDAQDFGIHFQFNAHY